VPPTIYIDDRLINSFDNNFDELYLFKMDFVDYVFIDKSGFGEGLKGAGGVIKIYTNPILRRNSYVSGFQDTEIPLTFTRPTKFYTPKYSFYQTEFYKNYGVVDWQPNCSVNANGELSFKLFDRGANSNITLYIEGTANNGAFISEVKTLSLE
ncbi:MAG: hypothetical protein P8X62_02405, partial [Flavobacteriaceae bacterium]